MKVNIRASLGRRHFLAGSAAGAAALGFPRLALAASYPDKPVKLIMPYPSGGSADIYSRAVSLRLERVIGQPVLFDYRPGGGSAIGAELTARAPADGYTIGYMDSGAFAFVPHFRKVGYDPNKSFIPIAALGVVPFIMVVHGATPFRDVQSVIDHAKANPDKLNIASSGVGSPHHLIAELFKQRTGAVMRHVPYKGAGQFLADLASGQVEVAMTSIGAALPFLQTGKVRALGVTAGKRSTSLPDLPTIAEQGVPGFDAKPWACYVAPAGTPAEPIDFLRSAFRKAFDDAELVTSLQKQGVEDVGATNAGQIAELMRADFASWGEVIRRANIKLDS